MRGLGALEAGRSRCADCGRTPLTGEQVHLFGERSSEIVCELCSQLRGEPPLASETVRHERARPVRAPDRAGRLSAAELLPSAGADSGPPRTTGWPRRQRPE